MRAYRFLFSMGLLFCCFFPLTAQIRYEESVYPASARTHALGGSHAALADSYAVLFTNPAGFNSVKPEMIFTALDVNLSGPVFDVANVIISGDLLGLLRLVPGLHMGMTLGGPVAFGYVGNGAGFGLFNTTNTVIENSGPTDVTVAISETFLLSGGTAFQIMLPDSWRSRLDLGVLFKGFISGEVSYTKSALNIAALLSPLAAISEPFDTVSGIGMDVGARFSWLEILSFALVARDLYTPTLRSTFASAEAFYQGQASTASVHGIVPMNLDFGMLFNPKITFLEQYISDFKLLLDYHDLLGFLTHAATASNPILNVGLGMEIEVLEILNIRGGFNQGLFSAGLGLELGFLTLHTAMYGSELSTEPGLRSVFNIQVSVEINS